MLCLSHIAVYGLDFFLLTTGSARTQGYYRMPTEERFRRPWCVGRSLIGEDGRRRPIPLMPATVQAQLGGDAALQGTHRSLSIFIYIFHLQRYHSMVKNYVIGGSLS